MKKLLFLIFLFSGVYSFSTPSNDSPLGGPNSDLQKIDMSIKKQMSVI